MTNSMTFVDMSTHHCLLGSRLSLHSLAFDDSTKAVTSINGQVMTQKP